MTVEILKDFINTHIPVYLVLSLDSMSSDNSNSSNQGSDSKRHLHFSFLTRASNYVSHDRTRNPFLCDSPKSQLNYLYSTRQRIS
jgi:hypothetical protein